MNNLNERAWQLYRANSPNALDIAYHALQLARQIQYKAGIGNSLNRIGLIHRSKGAYKEALLYFEESKKTRLSIGDTLGAAGVQNNIGVLYRLKGDVKKAYENLLAAARIFEQKKAFKYLANAYENLGITFEGEEKWDKAMNNYELALEYHVKEKDSVAMASIYYNIAAIYFYKDNLKQAESYSQQALRLYRQTGLWEVDALSLLANIASSAKDYITAERYYKQGISIYQEESFSDLGLADLHTNYGNLKIKKGQIDDAIKEFRKAKAILRNKGGPEDQFYLAQNFKDAFVTLGKFDSAYNYQKVATLAKDSIYRLKSIRANAEMNAKFETEQSKKELAEEKLLNQQYKTRQSILLISFVAVLFISILSYWFLRQQQRNTKLIAQQKIQIRDQEVADLLQSQELKMVNAMLDGQETERKRIAKDLHDHLGSLLTTLKWKFDDIVENTDTAQSKSILEANQMLDKAYGEVRRIAHNMNSGVLAKFGLIAALEELRNSITQSGKMKVELIHYKLDHEYRLENQLEIIVYRMIQELISNILKHAQADQLSIQLSRMNNQLQLAIEDNGRGFNVNEATSGMGLQNIMARLQQINGQMEIDSGKGGGTSIYIDIPL
ncbi:MAG: sensor histidine kinase [Bacteroidota bacterium]